MMSLGFWSSGSACGIQLHVQQYDLTSVAHYYKKDVKEWTKLKDLDPFDITTLL